MSEKSAKPKETSSLESLRNAFSHFTLLLTVAFGLVTTLTLLEEPSKTLQPTFATSTVRGPASVSTGKVSSSLKPYMSSIEVGCDSNSEVKTISEYVRIKSQSCGLNLAENNMVVKNETNGFSATIFHQRGETFTTDYVALVQGQNKILIKSSADDSHPREIIVVRE